MARTVLPIVGALVGGYFGGPTGAQIGWAAGSAIGGAVDPVKNQGPRIGDVAAQTSAEGAPRGIVYGTASVVGNLIASGVLIKQEVETSEGKGGPVTSTEHAYRTYAIRICEGPIAALLRVWEDDKLVYDVRPASLMLAESARWIYGCNVYLGTEDQLPDTFLQILVSGIGETPAYRGTAYMVFVGRDLTDRRGSIPQYRFEVAGTASLDQTLAPLQILAWAGSSDTIPSHSQGETSYTDALASDSFNNPAQAIASITASAASVVSDSYVSETGPFATNYIGFITSVDATFSRFSGGAVLEPDDPRYVYLRLAARTAGQITFNGTPGPGIAEEVVAAGGGSPSAQTFYVNRSETESFTGSLANTANLFKTDDTFPSTGEFSFPVSGTGSYDINANVVLPLTVERVPSPPEGFTKVVGTAKVLADNEYRSNALYQVALGPVLLPGDPDYDNATFWSDARAAAVLDGTLAADATSPVVVSAYATGYGTAAGAGIPLSGIVSDIHERCKVPEDKFDVSELTDEVAGLVLAGDYNGGDAIDVLRGPYFFDKSEYDRKIWYPKRGKPVVETLTIDDLVEEPDTSKREQASEYPRKFHLFYQHANSGYAVVKATSARSSSDIRVVGEKSSQVPVVLNEDQAAQTSQKMHKTAWADAEGEVAFSVPLSFIRFVPADNVGLVLRNRVMRLRIDEMDNADGVISIKTRHDRQSAYTSNVTGVPIPDPTPPPDTITGTTVLAVLDIPSRVDSEDDLNIYYAVTGAQTAWNGASVQRSLDAGATYATAASISTPSVIGTLQADVASASEHYTDTTNTVKVRLIRNTQSLESITNAEFLSEGGAFALESGGSWEIMQYRDVSEDSAGDFTLSTLHRGRMNSGATAHTAGARFVLLDRVTHVAAQSAWIGQSLTHRAPSFGQSPELASEQTATYVGRSQLEWPVASLVLMRDGSDVITATWAPRHRFGTDDVPIASINFQGYRVTIDGSVTFDTLTPSFTYDASALGSPITVSVSALNRITGAGPATSGSV